MFPGTQPSTRLHRARRAARAVVWALGLCCMIGSGLVAPRASAQPAPTPMGEYAVKAAILFNLFKFVEWPDSVAGASSYQLCLVGNDPFGEAFNGILGKMIGNKPVTVRRNVRREDARTCHMLYLSEDDERLNRAMLTEVARHPVLVVADAGTGAEMIQLVRQDDRMGFEVNLEAAQPANLRFSAQLLKLARQVKGRQ